MKSLGNWIKHTTANDYIKIAPPEISGSIEKSKKRKKMKYIYFSLKDMQKKHF